MPHIRMGTSCSGSQDVRADKQDLAFALALLCISNSGLCAGHLRCWLRVISLLLRPLMRCRQRVAQEEHLVEHARPRHRHRAMIAWLQCQKAQSRRLDSLIEHSISIHNNGPTRPWLRSLSRRRPRPSDLTEVEYLLMPTSVVNAV